MRVVVALVGEAHDDGVVAFAEFGEGATGAALLIPVNIGKTLFSHSRMQVCTCAQALGLLGA